MITCIAQVVSIKNLGRTHYPYIFIRYFEYNQPYDFPAKTRVEYLKAYLPLYDFIPQELEYVTYYGDSIDTVTGLKYKSL